jgi:ribosome recycling factor
MNVNDFKTRLTEVTDWLQKELSTVRTGRATITLLDGVMVEVYGAKSPINQNASVNIEDAKTVRVVPWDKGIIKDIESAITRADLGVSVSADDEGVRIKFPDLTTETREMLAKKALSKVEEAKVSARSERANIIKQFENAQKSGEISEDELKRGKDDVQKMVDEKNKEFDGLGKAKEQEIKS